MTNRTMIFAGVVGSVAQGLATENSDQDLSGVFSYPTETFWTVNPSRTLPESDVSNGPQDYTYHELGKFLKLATKSSPSALEVLNLAEYTEMEPVYGEALLALKDAFPSARYVRNAYLGYAESQYRKMVRRGEGRNGKLAKHLFRLLDQGQHLYETGEFLVQVDDREKYFRYMEMSLEEIGALFRRRKAEFLGTKSGLQDEAQMGVVDDYFRWYRKNH